MLLTKNENLHYWQFGNVSKFLSIQHLVTFKNSLGTGASILSGPGRETSDHLAPIAKFLNIDIRKVFLPKQTHNSNVCPIDYNTNQKDLHDIDALVSGTHGICLAVKAADCVPILLYDPASPAMAIVHSGWRCTVNKILMHTLFKMQEYYHSNPGNIIAAIGPSICVHCYEIGNEVVKR